jgi:hypothetical protein
MRARDSEIEQRSAFADVAKVNDPNESDRVAVVHHPEALDLCAREVHHDDVVRRQAASRRGAEEDVPVGAAGLEPTTPCL